MRLYSDSRRAAWEQVDATEIVQGIVDELIAADSDLSEVSLDEMKERLADALRSRWSDTCRRGAQVVCTG